VAVSSVNTAPPLLSVNVLRSDQIERFVEAITVAWVAPDAVSQKLIRPSGSRVIERASITGNALFL